MTYFTINNPDWDGNEWICAPPTAGMHDATYDVVREPCLPLELRPPCLEGIRLTQENGMDDASYPHHVMYCGLPNSIFFEKPLFPYILSDNNVFDNECGVKGYELYDKVMYNASELDDKKSKFPHMVKVVDEFYLAEFEFDTGEYGYDHVVIPGEAFELSDSLKNSSLNLDTVKAVLSEGVMIPVLRVKEAFDENKLRYNIHFVAPPVWGQFIPSWEVTVYYDNYQLPWWAYQVKLNATKDAKKAEVVIKILGIDEEIHIEDVEIVPFETLKAKGEFGIPEVRTVQVRGWDVNKYKIVSLPRGIEARFPEVVVSVRYNGKVYPLNCSLQDTESNQDPPVTDKDTYVWPHVKYIVRMDGDDEEDHYIEVGADANIPVVVFKGPDKPNVPDPDDPLIPDDQP
jgi:hypothetical protein